MATEQIGFAIGQLLAGADLSAKQFHGVKQNSAGAVISASVAGEVILGVLQDKPASGAEANVASVGISKLVAGGVVSINDKLMVNASGRFVVSSGSNAAVVALAMSAAAADGEIISGYIFPSFAAEVVTIKTLLNQLRALFHYAPLGNPGFAIDTNFDIKNANAISYLNNGTLKSLAANTNFNTGTTAAIATVKWGVAVLTLDASATATVTWFTSAGAGYATEAAAIAAITGLVATHTVLGYVTVLAAGATWTAGTDALAGGTGGTPATTTNYYNLINPNAQLLGAAVS